MKLPSALKGCRGAVLDTMLLVYLFENHGGVLVTNDHALKKIDDVRVILLDDVV